MKNKFLYLLLMIMEFAILCSCVKGSYLTIKNNSDQSIRFLSPITLDKPSIIYPDTSLHGYDHPPYTYKEVPPYNSRTCIELHSYPLSYIYENLNADTLSFFIFSSVVLDSLPWDTIVSRYLVLQRYDLSVQEIDRTGEITFPPDSTMKHIHMWPPYGTYDENGQIRIKQQPLK